MLLSGCASHPPLLSPLLSSESGPAMLELEATPFHAQKKYQCGPAALATLLEDSGVPVTAESLVPLVYLPEKRGSLQIEMVAVSRRYQRIPYVIRPDLDSLLAELQAGRPVLVLQNLGFTHFPVWHYAVVIGYSAERDEMILRSGVTRREALNAHRFLDTWKRSDHWAMVLLRPGDLPAVPDQLPYLKAVAALERSAPAESLIAAYRAALDHWPESSIALFGLAVAQHAKGDLAAAELSYRRLLEAEPDFIAAHNNLAEVLADRGCYREAKAVIRQALQQESGALQQELVQTEREIGRRIANPPSPPLPCRRPRIQQE
ncbi:MAG: PA2778 family cysteine peptidase [Candidatus Thiodiazotropha sp.]